MEKLICILIGLVGIICAISMFIYPFFVVALIPMIIEKILFFGLTFLAGLWTLFCSCEIIKMTSE